MNDEIIKPQEDIQELPRAESFTVGSGQVETKSGSYEKDFLQTITYGVVIVLFLGFLGLVIGLVTLYIQSLNEEKNTYQELVNKINQQSYKIDFLNHQLELQSQNLLTSKGQRP